jgi:predicted dehydrogenase
MQHPKRTTLNIEVGKGNRDMKIGIIGCGAIVPHHLYHVLRHPRVRTIGLADRDIGKAAQTAEQYALTHVFADFRSMHRALGLDIVHILTPPATHAKLAIEAMNAGCHVLVEKPMALTVEDADEMIQCAAANRVQLAVDHNSLLNPIIARADALVRNGSIGRLTHVDTRYSFDPERMPGLDRSNGGAAHWATQLPGGLLTDHLSHPASILLHFMAPPLTPWAISKHNGILPGGLPDELRVLIDGGAVTGLLSLSLGTFPDCFTVNIYGSRMTLHANLTNMTLVARKRRPIPKKISRLVDNLDQAAQLVRDSVVNAWGLFTGKIRPPGDIGPVIRSFYQSIDNHLPTAIAAESGKQLVVFMNDIRQTAIVKGSEHESVSDGSIRVPGQPFGDTFGARLA